MSAATDPQGPVEQVVLLDESGRAVGAADKAGVHHADTPLHLAFSCYVFDDADRILLTQRALGKRTFPGVWTNSCCGHPGPGEHLEEAVRRRLDQELGLEVGRLDLVLPAFRYRAEMQGVVENEMCPVLVTRTTAQPVANPDEVEDVEWVPWSEFRASVLDGTRDISPWCALQVRALPEDPWAAPARPTRELPPALHD